MARRFIRLLNRFVLWVFFRRIDVHGLENVPSTGPLLFAANHPNVLLDILVLGVFIPRSKLRWIGKSTLFKIRLFGWVLRRLGVIPVARPQDKESRLASNRDMLREAIQTLREGHSLVIFPEGLSHAQIKVMDLKHGAARIALSAVTDGAENVLVVPVGLTFFDPGTFRSDVEIHFGKPTEIYPFVETFTRDHHQAEKDLTAVIHERIVSLTRHVENSDWESVVYALSRIYAGSISTEFDESNEFSKRLRAEQEIIRSVHYFGKSDPRLVQSFSSRLRSHLRKLRRLNLEPQFMPSHSSKPTRRLIFILLLLPVALYGFVLNALPYYLTKTFAGPYRTKPEMVATAKLLTGVAIFVAYYCVLAVLLYLLSTMEIAVLLTLTLPSSGLFTMYYDEQLLRTVPLWQNVIAPRRRRYLLWRILRERIQLMRDLDSVKELYLRRDETDNRTRNGISTS